jgi:1,4-alpha-glucan branching enzyme
MSKGYLAIILHAHLPYVRHPEFDLSLEERWLYEAMTETYIPLLLLMERLIEEGVDFRLTFSLTPTLASMLLDPLLQSRYLARLERLIELAGREIRRTRSQPAFHGLAHRYFHFFQKIRAAYINRYGRDLISAFRRLQGSGKVEIIAGAATHGYLPLLAVNPAAVRAQVRIGVDFYRQLLGRSPKGFWLPECAYYRGVEEILGEQGIRYTILETHGITRADPRPRYGVFGPVCCPCGVAAFGRDPESSKQVWSSRAGYPGDYDYREFYRDIAFDLDGEYIGPYLHPEGIRADTGIKYYRITGQGDHKEIYVPERAERKAELHAANFIFNREKQVEYLASTMDRKPLVLAPYDAELFGHWWFEGPLWLDSLIRQIASRPGAVRLVTLSEYLEENPSHQVCQPCPSSWGFKGFNEVWLNGQNDWIYPQLHRAADKMEVLARKRPRARSLKERALSQAARELLLAQASDWAFMISGQTAEYGRQRTETHLARFHKLYEEINGPQVDREALLNMETLDNIFPQIDYRAFS